jgi:hypothetical protein
MAVKLKRLVSEAGAGEDKSYASDDSHPDMFTLLKAFADTQNDLVAQLNQVIADVVTTATPVVPGVEVES